MDKHDRQLISYLARGIPITSTPYRGIAAQLGIDEAELFIRLQRLRDKGSIEAIRASFDGKMLGYRSTLFAARLPAGQTEQAAEQLMLTPG